jgi:hypothetical protein
MAKGPDHMDEEGRGEIWQYGAIVASFCNMPGVSLDMLGNQSPICFAYIPFYLG